MKEWGLSPNVVLLVARNTLAEAVRQKLIAAILLVAAVLVLGVQGLREFNFGAPELKFIADFGLGAIGVFGPILAITATTQLFLGEIESRTALTLLAKPVRRTDFIFGKLLAILLLNAVFCALVLGLLLLVLRQREGVLLTESRNAIEEVASGGFPYLDLAIAGVAQWLKLAVLSAWILLLASFARTQLYTLVAGFLLFAICQLQSFAQQTWGKSLHWFPQLASASISWIFPDFQIFELADSIGQIDASLCSRVAAYGSIHLVALALLAAIAFRQREL